MEVLSDQGKGVVVLNLPAQLLSYLVLVLRECCEGCLGILQGVEHDHGPLASVLVHVMHLQL